MSSFASLSRNAAQQSSAVQWLAARARQVFGSDRELARSVRLHLLFLRDLGIERSEIDFGINREDL